MTLEDVGKCIELVYTPMRKDGVQGNSRTIISEVIAPGELYFQDSRCICAEYYCSLCFNIFVFDNTLESDET